MDTHNKNIDFLTASLKGTMEVKIYDEEGNLKRVHTASNLVTTNGINRLAEVLVDGYNSTFPSVTANSITDPTSTLKSRTNFGEKDGEIFGVNFIDWPGRYKSTFSRTGYQNYITGKEKMFDNDPNTSTYWEKGHEFNVQFPPDDNYGYTCDFGITDVTNEIFNATLADTWYDIANKNLRFEGMVVKSNDEVTTYVDGLDYEWTTGDGDTFGQIRILSGGPTGVDLKISYSWYDVPQVPIVGFAFETAGGYQHDSFFNAWKWSLDQGQTRSDAMFPNVQGHPQRPGWETHSGLDTWYPTWHGESNGRWYYFMNMLPWAVKNPTQLSWYGNTQDYDKHVYDFQLLGLKMPKIGAHAIGLGTGNGIPSVSDTNLFNFNVKKVTHRKHRTGTGLQIISYLDFNEGNGTTYTEAGLYYPLDESVYWKKNVGFSTNRDDGGLGGQTAIGTNGVYKLSPMDADDFNELMSHAMFDTPWTKNAGERAEIVYNLSIYWS